MALAPGQQEEIELKDAGFTPDEMQEWRQSKSAELNDAGLTVAEQREYFGIPDADMGDFQKLVNNNLTKATAELKQKETPKAPKEATGFVDAFEAGFGISATGLLVNGQMPSTILREDAHWAMRLANTAGTLAGDSPFMVAGAVSGTAIGASMGTAIAPVAGTAIGGVVGGGAGAMAVPEAIRQTLIQKYEKGEIENFQDFWTRATEVFINTEKAAFIGAATAGAGGVAGKIVGPLAGMGVRTTAKTAAEVVTMVNVGKAMEGEVASAQDYADAAVLVGGLGATGVVAGKLRSRWAKNGTKPSDLAVESTKDISLKQELISETRLKPDDFGPPAPEKPPAPVTPPTLSEAEAKIQSQISGKPEKAGEPVTMERIRQDFVDKFASIKTEAGEEAYKTARMVSDFGGTVINFFEKGVVNFKTKEVVGKPFAEVIAPFKENMEGFKNYLVSKRVIELEGRGIKSGFDLEAAKVVAKDGQAKYAQGAKDLAAWQDGVLKYAEDSGILTAESVKEMKAKNQSYIPFARLTEEGAAQGKGKKPGAFKAIKGSENKIVDPFEATLENTLEIIKAAEQNKAKTEVVDAVLARENQTVLKKVKQQMRAIEIKPEELPGLADSETIFRPDKGPLRSNEVEILRNGKREVYEVEPLLREALQSIEGNREATSLVVNYMSKVTAVKKFGISFTPEFVARNVIRDQFTALMFSKAPINMVEALRYPGGIIEAVGSLIKKDDTYYAWLRSGGSNAAFMDIGTNYLKNDIVGLQKSTGFLDSVINQVKSAKDKAATAAMIAEQATRLAEFKRVTGGDLSAASLKKGGFASREITLDFQKIGAKMSAYNSITAFQNVTIQELDRLVTAFKENPKAVITRGTALITLPSVLLAAANHDDERYQALPNWQKNLFWIIPIDRWQEATPDDLKGYTSEYQKKTVNGKLYLNKGPIIRIPKPGILGVAFGSVPERMVDAFLKKNPSHKTDMLGTIFDLLSPSLVPDAVVPVAEQVFNKSLFTGAPLVPSHLEKVSGDMQYKEYTSETTKALGRLVGSVVPGARYGELKGAASPIVLENYFRSYTGTLGDYALKVSDTLLIGTGAVKDPVKPTSTLADIPVIKAFVVRYPTASTQHIVDFNESQRKAKEVDATIARFKAVGDFEGLRREFNNPEAMQYKLGQLRSMKNEIDRLHTVIDRVNAHVKDPVEKRQLIDGYYMIMNDMAKKGNEVVDEIRKNIKSKDSSKWQLFKGRN